MIRPNLDPEDRGPVNPLQLLTADDVAGLLQVSVRSIWRLVSAGEFPKPRYVGRLARWTAASVKDWVEQQPPGT